MKGGGNDNIQKGEKKIKLIINWKMGKRKLGMRVIRKIMIRI